MRGLTIGDIAVGDAAEVTHTVTVESIREFVAASGDDNPIHSDPAFAAETRFGRVIAPGMLTASFVSGVIGTRLPGPGTIYLSQDLRFLRPVYVGDRVTARVEVVERLEARNRLRLRTTCVNQAGELVLEGTAWVLPPATPVEYRGGSALSRRPPAALALMPPAALAVELLSWWMAGGLALATQALEAARALAPRPAALAPRPPAPDPIRP